MEATVSILSDCRLSWVQEQRAAAMMNEVVELQRERDLAMGRLRRMERTVSGMVGPDSQSVWQLITVLYVSAW